jgi:PAS domain S-box-containing protein
MREETDLRSVPPDFRALFEGAPDLYLVLSPNLDIVAVSDAYCRATMTVREEIVGRRLFDVFPDNPDDPVATGVNNLRASLDRVRRFRQPDPMAVQKYDIPRPAAQGGGFEERFWSPLNTPILDDHGELRWIVHRVEDVTELVRLRASDAAREELLRERSVVIQQLRSANQNLAQQIDERRRAEGELARTQSFLDVVVENIPAMVFVKDAVDLRFVLINRAGERLLGLDRSEFIGKSDYDLFPQEQADFFTRRDRAALESGELQITPEEPIDTRHLGQRLLRTLKMPVYDERGRPRYLLALAEDITERRAAEDALRKSEAQLRGFLLASPDAMIIVDRHGRILLASHRVETMFGYRADELVGQSINVLVPDRYRGVHSEHVRRYGAAPDVRNMGAGRELFALRKDGSEFPVAINLGPDETPDGPVVIAAVRDISEAKTMESQLRQAQKMESIGNLTGGLAHDFNNLLGVVIGNLDLLSDQLKDDPLAGELGREALEAALRGADLTQRLLAFARRQPLRPQRLSVNDIVERVSRLVGRMILENIEISLELGTDVWPVTVDPSQLEASLVNIINNAGDAMPDGGMLVIVTGNRYLDEDYVAGHPGLMAGDYVMIEISDTGTGMPSEVVAQIFEPFFTTKAEGKGTGLGLSMVFGFIKQSGGHVNVYSEVGVGTTFRLYLPRTVAAGELDAMAAASGPERGGSETVLAVEDNPGLRRVVARQLRELGYRLLEAPDGAGAVQILENEPVDLLFTDVVMPGGMSGFDLARLAAERWPAMKVVLTSGFPQVKAAGNGDRPLNLRLLTKPYRRTDLARILREALDDTS